MLLNCGVGEDSWESLGLQGDQILKEINSKGNQPWIFIGRTDAEAPMTTWWEEQIHWKRLFCCERLKAGGEGEDRGQDGWMASPTQWTWVWANPGRWWRTVQPDMLQSVGSQTVGHTLRTEQQFTFKRKGGDKKKGEDLTIFLKWHSRFSFFAHIQSLC